MSSSTKKSNSFVCLISLSLFKKTPIKASMTKHPNSLSVVLSHTHSAHTSLIITSSPLCTHIWASLFLTHTNVHLSPNIHFKLKGGAILVMKVFSLKDDRLRCYRATHTRIHWYVGVGMWLGCMFRSVPQSVIVCSPGMKKPWHHQPTQLDSEGGTLHS